MVVYRVLVPEIAIKKKGDNDQLLCTIQTLSSFAIPIESYSPLHYNKRKNDCYDNLLKLLS